MRRARKTGIKQSSGGGGKMKESFSSFSREELVKRLFSEACDRVLRNEDPDPATALVVALLQKEQVTDQELLTVLEAHCSGPWSVSTAEKLEIISRWCDRSGVPLSASTETNVVNNQLVYVGDYGDCCFAEASKGQRWAVWTRKGRLHIGFREEADAKAFRNADGRFSMEATGNKRIAFVVIEGGDTPEMIDAAAAVLSLLPQEFIPALSTAEIISALIKKEKERAISGPLLT